ncbi:AMP-binding protein [Plantactinospora sp. WMMC1484]|uniref:AMP-binding protein n=1 Tax=Plantactinospora sp. WMMC1484 TaxID=3404122 RepID=UPI003BF612DF
MRTSALSPLSWLDDPPPDRGLWVADSGDGWDFTSYAALAGVARQVAAGIIAGGTPAGAVVTIVERPGVPFAAALYGTMLAGCVPSPSAPPVAFQDVRQYAQRLTTIADAAGAQLVVVSQRLMASMADVAESRPIATVESLRERAGTRWHRAPADLALVQFTSGSTGWPKPVRVPYDVLSAQLAAIRDWLRMTPGDPTASWLPPHHDMGLVGCLLTPVAVGADLWLMRPEQFLRRPLRFLRRFAEGARLTAMPGFGLSQLLAKVRPEDLAGLDFSGWRAAIVGAERLSPAAFEQFHRLLAAHGFRREALLPAYGLAEATLAVTGLPLDVGYTVIRAAPRSLTPGATVVARPGGTELMGCGPPLGGAVVSVRDLAGRELPPDTVGEIFVEGASVTAGRALATGDAGFVHDGQLYVLGRLGDGMKIRGRTVFAEDLEMALNATGGPMRVAVLLGEADGVPTAVALFEQARPEWLELARRTLRRQTEGAVVRLLDGPRGAIARTSSGKPRRRHLWERFLAGNLGSVVDHT